MKLKRKVNIQLINTQHPQINEALARVSNFSVSPVPNWEGCDYQSKHDNNRKESINHLLLSSN